MIGALIALCVVSVVVLTAMGKDSTSVIQFMTTAIIPTVAALWAGDKATKAKQAAESAEANTNGRMRQLIDMVHDKGGEVDPEEYEDVLNPPAQG